MVNRRSIQFQSEKKRGYYRKDSIYLGLKQRYGSPGIAVERDVLARKQQESALANIGFALGTALADKSKVTTNSKPKNLIISNEEFFDNRTLKDGLFDSV
jgi:hypothetical protein